MTALLLYHNIIFLRNATAHTSHLTLALILALALTVAYDPREAFVSALAELWSPMLYKFLDGSFQV